MTRRALSAICAIGGASAVVALGVLLTHALIDLVRPLL